MSALPQPTGPDEPERPSPLDAIVRGPSSASGQVSGEATHPGQPGTSAKGAVGPAVAHSPLVVSAGYSVEFAFSLFDRAIERGTALLKPEARSSPTDSGRDTKKA